MVSTQEAIRVEGLSKVYQRGKERITALMNVDFKVRWGECVGVLGPNGAGKTTLIKSLLGLIEPSSGTIYILGYDLKRQRKRALSAMAAVLEGSRNVFWRLTTRENLEYFARLHGLSPRRLRSYIDYLIEAFDLQQHLNKEARMLSKGMQQRLATACALVKQTPILMLDEPTLGLDIESALRLRSALLQLVRDERRTILLTSHEMELVESVCERVIILQDGRIVTDSRTDALKELFRSSNYLCVVRPLDPSIDPIIAFNHLPYLRAVEQIGNRIRVTIECSHPLQLYEILERFQSARCAIESVSHEEPNLKEAYLRIVHPQEEDRRI